MKNKTIKKTKYKEYVKYLQKKKKYLCSELISQKKVFDKSFFFHFFQEKTTFKVHSIEFKIQKKNFFFLMYSCTKCRCVLFHQSQVVPHEGNTEAPGHKNFVKNKYTVIATGNNCTSIFIDPGMVSWAVAGEENSEEMKKYQKRQQQQMKKKKTEEDDEEEKNAEEDEDEEADDDEENDYQNYASYFRGKAQSDDEKDLLCPNARCKAKLGSKQWQGTQCSCGAWVTPAFKVLISRVDFFPVQTKAVTETKEESEKFQ
jgi:hypothetical protein